MDIVQRPAVSVCEWRGTTTKSMTTDSYRTDTTSNERTIVWLKSSVDLHRVCTTTNSGTSGIRGHLDGTQAIKVDCHTANRV
jgi:hypothetical protein